MASEEGSTYSEMSSHPSSMRGAYDLGSGGFSVAEMGSLMSSSEEDALMMDRPFLDYINEMLMDEAMEDRPLVQQDLSYQAIVSGFYDVIGERSAPVSYNGGGSVYDIHGECFPPLQSSSDSSNGSIHEHSVPIYSSTNSIYNLMDEHSPLLQSSTPGENGSFYGIFPEQSTLPFSSEMLSAPTSNSCSSDEQLYRLESPDIVNSFYNINSEPSPLIQPLSSRDHFNASISGSGSEFVRLDSHDPPNNEYGWMDHSINSSPATPVVAAHDNLSDGHTSSAEGPRNGHVSFVKNKDLDVEADYERLYVENEGKHHYDGKPHNGLVEDSGRASGKGLNGSAHEKPRSRHVNANGEKGAAAESMSGKHKNKRNGKSDVCVSLDLKELLVSCAQAVAVGDVRRAEDVLQQLRNSGASANGNGLHRSLHYFCKALEARMHGTGSCLYSDAKYNNQPSTADFLKALKVAFGFIPLSKIAHYFANQSILKAAEGATHLHIIDYGIFYGVQWPCLINALADRKGGPPKLIITGIEFPQPGSNPAQGLEDIGRRLTEYAKTYKVPFEYHAIAASKWEDVNPLLEDPPYGRKVLVLNCMNRLKNILDECVSASSTSTSSQRQSLLDTMCNLKPDLFVVAVTNANHGSPFFVSRFRDALNYYSYKFDMMATTWVEESPERMIVERDCMYRDLLNVVACEGVERVERPENFKQWQARILRAGFEHVPIMPSVLLRSKSHVQDYYHKEFIVDHDSNRWILMSWKGRPTQAMSAWKPRAS